MNTEKILKKLFSLQLLGYNKKGQNYMFYPTPLSMVCKKNKDKLPGLRFIKSV